MAAWLNIFVQQYGDKFLFGDVFGLGKVTSTTPKRDAIWKERFWLTNVVFKMQDEKENTHTFTTASDTCAIQILYPSAEKPLPTADCFPLASFDLKFSLEVQETLKVNIRQMMQKCNFTNKEAEEWELFLSHMPENVCDIKAEECHFQLHNMDCTGGTVLES